MEKIGCEQFSYSASSKNKCVCCKAGSAYGTNNDDWNVTCASKHYKFAPQTKKYGVEIAKSNHYCGNRDNSFSLKATSPEDCARQTEKRCPYSDYFIYKPNGNGDC